MTPALVALVPCIYCGREVYTRPGRYAPHATPDEHQCVGGGRPIPEFMSYADCPKCRRGCILYVPPGASKWVYPYHLTTGVDPGLIKCYYSGREYDPPPSPALARSPAESRTMNPIRCFLLEPTGEQQSDGAPTGSQVHRPTYKRADTGDVLTLNAAPAGAMWYAPWWAKGPDDRGPLCVKVPRNPDGSGVADWNIDGASTTNAAGAAWKREGEPPDVTVTPSIFINPPAGFHGHIIAGYIFRDGEQPTSPDRLAVFLDDVRKREAERVKPVYDEPGANGDERRAA